MLKISDIISKPIFSLYECSYIGTVNDFFMTNNNKKIGGFLFLDDESDINNSYIQANKILNLNNEIIIIKNINSLKVFNNNFQTKIINQKAISVLGEDLGTINDVFFDENYYILGFETSLKLFISIENLLKIGKDILVFDFAENKIKISNYKPKNKIIMADLPDIKVSILNNSEKNNIPIISKNFDESSFFSDNKIEGEFEFKNFSNISIPKKIINKSSILGKISKKTIFGLNGEIIIKDTQVITQQIIEKAARHGKLFELKSAIE